MVFHYETIHDNDSLSLLIPRSVRSDKLVLFVLQNEFHVGYNDLKYSAKLNCVSILLAGINNLLAYGYKLACCQCYIYH